LRISVLGAGTWGTALAILLSNNGHEVTLWSKLQREIDSLRSDRTKIPNLPGSVLPDNIQLTYELQEALIEPDIIVFAVASPYTRETAHAVYEYVKPGQIIVNVGKGIEEKTLYTLTEIISDEIPDADVAVLSGPSHAEEVSRLIPTTCVVGAKTLQTAKIIQDAFMSESFRVYTSPDVVGIELGGSLKNVIALAAGMADGLGFGDNTKAALMTRGIAEISRLGVKMGGRIETFSGLSGIGDLIVTCSSIHSRNRNAGYYIGQGMSVKDAMEKVAQVVEGVYSAKAALALARKYEVNMPIVEQVNHILFDDKSVKAAVADLLLRDKTHESDNFTW